ncbi:hypothetical protein NDU88_001140 [Pleurodeles waltl]|uniref:Uncharacterized protein n=1 Tax=Pleurodeles waltl TaxID=8319 RepID=A0AAV7P304_PLEWA|nr:hypothetical protein NDU88_001140 [Pleurodeles waltl]
MPRGPAWRACFLQRPAAACAAAGDLLLACQGANRGASQPSTAPPISLMASAAPVHRAPHNARATPIRGEGLPQRAALEPLLPTVIGRAVPCCGLCGGFTLKGEASAVFLAVPSQEGPTERDVIPLRENSVQAVDTRNVVWRSWSGKRCLVRFYIPGQMLKTAM